MTATAPPVTGPFGRPPMTACGQRIYKPSTGAGSDGYGPLHSGPANIAPQGKGLHAVEFQKAAGQSLRLAFSVDASNKLPDFFEFIKETNGTTKIAMEACITRDFDGHDVVAKYTGRDTDTDQAHAWYVAAGNPHNGVTHALPPGLYYYWCDTPDGSAAHMPVGHSGSN